MFRVKIQTEKYYDSTQIYYVTMIREDKNRAWMSKMQTWDFKTQFWIISRGIVKFTNSLLSFKRHWDLHKFENCQNLELQRLEEMIIYGYCVDLGCKLDVILIQ